MLITTEGVVLRERAVGENDKYIDILTKNIGVIEVCVKGVKKITAKNASSTQLFSYSKFCILKSHNKYIINSTEPINLFYNIRLDIKKLALASYFADIIKYCVVSNENSEIILRLFLNCLYYISEGTRQINLIKSIFELRLLTEIGLMPDIVGCSECGSFEKDINYLFLNEGKFICCDCYNGTETESIIKINKSILYILRKIVFSDYNQLFHFKVSDENEKIISDITETYLEYQLQRNFKTLDFYKSF